MNDQQGKRILDQPEEGGKIASSTHAITESILNPSLEFDHFCYRSL